MTHTTQLVSVTVNLKEVYLRVGQFGLIKPINQNVPNKIPSEGQIPADQQRDAAPEDPFEGWRSWRDAVGVNLATWTAMFLFYWYPNPSWDCVLPLPLLGLLGDELHLQERMCESHSALLAQGHDFDWQPSITCVPDGCPLQPPAEGGKTTDGRSAWTQRIWGFWSLTSVDLTDLRASQGTRYGSCHLVSSSSSLHPPFR